MEKENKRKQNNNNKKVRFDLVIRINSRQKSKKRIVLVEAPSFVEELTQCLSKIGNRKNHKDLGREIIQALNLYDKGSKSITDCFQIGTDLENN